MELKATILKVVESEDLGSKEVSVFDSCVENGKLEKLGVLLRVTRRWFI